ncbi:hypothetical protein GCM10023093_09830 [Nemorincola caseinilytica]|uniref:DoxX family protein n=1 Tax=Nemorincola caseinilytica TaxID=2054315 RepID=A0ABP8N7V1_9BACT
MSGQLRIVLLWVILVICMILHFDYHVSEIFYGIDVRKAGANGTVPPTILIIRTAFHFLPLLYAVTLMWYAGAVARKVNMVLSILYLGANAAHFIGEVRKGDNPSQIMLLGLTFVLSAVLVMAARQWVRGNATNAIDNL